MNSASKYAVIALLVSSLTGCAPKEKTIPTPPPQAQAPSIDSGKPGAMYPPPLTPTTPTQETPPPAPQPTVASTQPPEPEPEVTKPKKTPLARKSKPSPAKTASSGNDTAAAATSSVSPGSAPAASGQPSAPAPEPPAQEAASNQPATASPIGQLTTGESSGGVQSRRETSELITSTENGLNGIKRSLNSQEQQTAAQIRTFLTKARQALTTDDIDGAHTLATKAKVLLDELTKG